MNKKINRMVTLIMGLVFALSSISAYGAEKSNYSIQVAYIQNINKDGSNIGTDLSHPEHILSDKEYEMSFSINENKIFADGQIENTPFSVSGSFATVNENKNILLYSGNDNQQQMEVVYLSIERKLDETPLFFEGFFRKHQEYNNVLKIYLQPCDSNSLIQIEVFLEEDHVTRYLNDHDIKRDASLSDTLQSWFAKLYSPVDNDKNEEMEIKGNDTPQVKNFSKTYNINGATVTFRFVVSLYYDVGDIISGGNGWALLYYNIDESRTTSSLPANNSSTQSYIRIEEANVRFKSMKNLILQKQVAHRNKIQKNSGSISIGFSISFGYSWGLISAGGSINFTKEDVQPNGEVILDRTNEECAKGTECGTLPSNRYLCKQGGYYGFTVYYKGKDGQPSGSGTVYTYFTFYLHNLYDSSGSGNKTFVYGATLNVN